MNDIENISNIVGKSRCYSSQELLEPYIQDVRGRYQGKPLVVTIPRDKDALRKLVCYCHSRQIGIVPQGGNTGYSGGALPDNSGKQVVIRTEKLDQIIQLDKDIPSITVQAGVTLQKLKEECERNGFLFPLEIGSKGSCQIGGNLATNAGGLNVLRYGMARDSVLGLEVILPDGRVLSDLRPLKKNNSGYDLKHLFVGSEGTLGIITAATLKIIPAPSKVVTVLAAFDDASYTVKLLSNLGKAFGSSVNSFELLEREILEMATKLFINEIHFPFGKIAPYNILFELSVNNANEELEEQLVKCLGELPEPEQPVDATIAQTTKQAGNLWKLREVLPEAEKRWGDSIKHDISVPTPSIPDFIQDAKNEVTNISNTVGFSIFGHLGDGNLHFNVVYPRTGNTEFVQQEREKEKISERIYWLVHKHGGSFSAEHGIGQEKIELLESYGDPVSLEIMRVLKRCLDPSGIMNPGKIFTK